nr:hypothetical protein CFP56_09919 [Quercus suber]
MSSTQATCSSSLLSSLALHTKISSSSSHQRNATEQSGRGSQTTRQCERRREVQALLRMQGRKVRSRRMHAVLDRRRPARSMSRPGIAVQELYGRVRVCLTLKGCCGCCGVYDIFRKQQLDLEFTGAQASKFRCRRYSNAQEVDPGGIVRAADTSERFECMLYDYE